MLSNKRSRIFVSFLTLMAFLSVLVVGLQSVGVQAQGPSGVGDIRSQVPEAIQHERDAAAAAQRAASDLTIHKSVASSTNIQVGDVQTYSVKITNNTATTLTQITLKDPIPHFGRYNRIATQTNATFQFDSTDYEIETSSSFTLTPDSSAELVYEIDTTALCGQAVENKVSVTQGGSTVDVTRNTIAWDNIYSNVNFEIDPGNIEMTGSWSIGSVASPTIGAVSGGGALATNPAGLYTSTGVAGQNRTHAATVTLNFTTTQVVDGRPLYLSWKEYFNANTNFDKAKVTLGGKEIHNLDTVAGYGGLGSLNSVSYRDVQINLLDHFTAVELQNKSLKLVFTLVASPNDNDFGWYVDDLATTSCKTTAVTVKKFAGLDSCTVDSTQNLDKSGAYTINMSDTVNYCYALKNTGNTEITKVKITDDKLGPNLTSATITDTDEAGVVVDIDPGNGWDTFTTSGQITQQILNTGEWTVGTAATGYSYTTNANATFNSIASTGTALEINDEEDVVTVTWPFTFTFFGTQYVSTTDSIVIGNNGSMLFTNTNTTLEGLDRSNSPLPLTGTAATASQGVFPLWDDYGDAPNAQVVYSETQGTAPNRTFIVQWTDMRHQNDPSNTDGITFQAILHETTNKIEFVYGDVSFNNATYNNGASATIGLNKSITEAVQYSFNGGQTIADNFAITFETEGAVTAQDTALVTIDSALALELEKTVSSVSVADACAVGAQSSITVTGIGTTVHYCYKINNTSEITFQSSTLTDTHLGTIMTDATTIIAPGTSYTHTESVTLNSTRINTATWTVDAGNYRAPELITQTQSTKFENIGFGGAVGTPVPFNNQNHDEEGDAALGFEFKFYGQKFTDVRIGRNGGMIFNSAVSGATDIFPDNQVISSTAGDVNHPMAIFPLWDDLDNDSGNVYYKTVTDTSGLRRFIVQWDRLLHYDNSTSNGTFQVVLYEGSNRIDFNYKDVEFGTSSQLLTETLDFGQSATIGLNRDVNKANLWTYNDGNSTNGVMTNTRYNLSVPITNNMTIRWEPLIGSATDAATVTVQGNVSIVFTKTVGTTPDTCAPTSSQEITVTAGQTVYYCFWIENTGDVTLTQHTLVDSMVGVNNTYNYNLGPGQVVNITEIPGGGVEGRAITTDTMNIAYWTATDGTNSATISDTVMVHIDMPPTAVEITGVTATNAGGQLPLGSLVVGMLLLVAGGYVVHRRRNQWTN